MNAKSRVLACIATLFVSGCAISGRDTLRKPEALKALAEGRTAEPDIVTGSDGTIFGTWAVIDDTNGTADIVFATYQSAERRWSRQVRLNPKLQSAVAGRQVGPRVAAGRDGQVFVSWVDRARDPAGDVMLAASDDGGRTFSAPRRVNDDDSNETGQEYHDIAVGLDGTVFVVWLDERDSPEHYRNQKQVYLATSKDGGKTFSVNRNVSRSENGVCPCCRPSVATSPNGSLHIVYRDRKGDSLFIRMRSRRPGDEDFAAAVTVSDPWKYPACPVNSPQITAGANGEVWVLWVDESDGDGALRWARSSDDGVRYDSLGRIEASAGRTRSASHLALCATSPLGAVATWENSSGQVCAARIPCGGATSEVLPFVVSGDAKTSSRSPAVTTTTDRVGLCWIEDSVSSSAPTLARDAPRLHLVTWSNIRPERSALATPTSFGTR